MPNDRIVYGAFTWDLIAITGNPQAPRWRLKTIKNPGVDGKAFKYMSREGAPQKLILEAAAVDAADEAAWINSMAALVGLQVTIYSSTSLSYSNYVVTDCTHVESVKLIVGMYGAVSLGSDGRLLTFELTVESPYGS